MSVVLSIIAIAVLTVAIVLSLTRQRQREGAKEEAKTRAQSAPAEAQQERFLRRTARIDARNAEHARERSEVAEGRTPDAEIE
jgi:hypothetical protein